MTGSMASDKEEPPAWRVFGNMFWALAWTSRTLWGSVARINWTFFTVSSASKDCKKSRVKDAKKNLWQRQEMLAPYLTGMPLGCQKSSLEMASRPTLYAKLYWPWIWGCNRSSSIQSIAYWRFRRCRNTGMYTFFTSSCPNSLLQIILALRVLLKRGKDRPGHSGSEERSWFVISIAVGAHSGTFW